jgi:CRISPR/Cas system-associated endonuclease/helicase Cas3
MNGKYFKIRYQWRTYLSCIGEYHTCYLLSEQITKWLLDHVPPYHDNYATDIDITEISYDVYILGKLSNKISSSEIDKIRINELLKLEKE